MIHKDNNDLGSIANWIFSRLLTVQLLWSLFLLWRANWPFLYFQEFWVLRQCICPHCSFSSWNVLFICLFLFFSFFFAYTIFYSFLMFFCCCLVLNLGFLNNVISYLLQFFWLFFMTLLCCYIFSLLLLYCVYAPITSYT